MSARGNGLSRARTRWPTLVAKGARISPRQTHQHRESSCHRYVTRMRAVNRHLLCAVEPQLMPSVQSQRKK
jgi:hypothetical protein